MYRSVIRATGSVIPERIIPNSHFERQEFFEGKGKRIYRSNDGIIAKFAEITGIKERRYAQPDENASDLAVGAAEITFAKSSIDRETLDYIIVAHNFGDVSFQSNRMSMVPSLSSRIKDRLKIRNPDCVGYDLVFGCPGWLEGVIQANYFIRSGDAKRCLVIGTETLSRVVDSYDRDSMILSDGAGAVIMESSTSNTEGVVAHVTQTHALKCVDMLRTDFSYSSHNGNTEDLFIKMNGRKVYEFALTHVPLAIKKAIEKSGHELADVKKILLHQANDKMDMAIVERLFKLYGMDKFPIDIVPMTISWLGNSSVATIPTLLDLMLDGKLEDHRVSKGDLVVLASVGAGMNINALVYQF